MRILVACEFSGTVRDAFRARGHDAVSCDLLPTEAPGLHYCGDVSDVLDGWFPVYFQSDCDPDGDGWCQTTDSDASDCTCFGPTQDGIEYIEKNGVLFGRPESAPGWDMLIAFPPCTYLCGSGLHWNKRRPERATMTEQGAAFFLALANADIPRIAIENPVGIMSTTYRKPDQIIQPYQFGHDASKATCLWLKGLPKIRPTAFVEPRIVNGRPRWSNQTDSGQNKLPPSATRSNERARTYLGVAEAMADQWGIA